MTKAFAFFKPIIWLAWTLAVLNSATAALTCVYDETPVMADGKTINWVCKTHADHCISYVKANGSIIQVNPERKETAHIGVIETFEASNGMVRPGFSDMNLRFNQTAVFGVWCDNESFERNVTPQFKEPFEFIDRLAWAQENTPYVLGVVLLIILLAIVASIIIRGLLK